MDGGSPAVLLRSQSGEIATLTLNRPEARNALSRGLMTALTDALAGDPDHACPDHDAIDGFHSHPV